MNISDTGISIQVIYTHGSRCTENDYYLSLVIFVFFAFPQVEILVTDNQLVYSFRCWHTTTRTKGEGLEAVSKETMDKVNACVDETSHFELIRTCFNKEAVGKLCLGYYLKNLNNT